MDRKSRPKRAVIAIAATSIAAFIAVVWAFLKEASEQARKNPNQARRLELLRNYLRPGGATRP
jgi:hypothetical protein